MIETVGDLRKALACYGDNLPIRTTLEVGGNLYYPHVSVSVKFKAPEFEKPQVVISNEFTSDLETTIDW